MSVRRRNAGKRATAGGGPEQPSLLRYYGEVKSRIVARAEEIRNILATLEAGRHLILEGAPGTTKSTILRAITEVCRIPFYLVEGNVDLTPSKLVGHFNPAKVMADDYKGEYFEKGPLTRAMEGGILYIDEFNRMPPDTANVLITAVEEGAIHIPRYGPVKAHPLFRVICAQNPFDDVGTMRISRAIYDRLCRIRLDYQSEEEEREIVRRKTGCTDETLVKIAVRVIQETRVHKEIKQGASVRGAMDMVAITLRLRDIGERDAEGILTSAMLSAMSGKVWLLETTARSAEGILREILAGVLRQPGMTWDPDGKGSKDDEGGGGPQGSRGASGEPAGLAERPAREEQGEGRPEGWDDLDYDPANGPTQLKRMARSSPEKVVEYFRTHHAVAREILQSADVLELYGHLRELLDPELEQIAKRYASRLIIRLASQIANIGVKTGSLYRSTSEAAWDEIDVDATLERVLDSPTRRIEENLVFLARRPEQKACVVMLDHSYSMRGIKVSMAALTAAAIALHFKQDYGVVAFSTNARILKGLTQYRPPALIAEEILSLGATGYTNMHEALHLGIGEMKGYEKKIGILLTDGDWTAGEDPIQVARRFDRLHVIGLEEPLQVEATYDEIALRYADSRMDIFRPGGGLEENLRRYHGSRIEMLAREGRGHFSYVRRIEEVPLAIMRCLIA
jgi:gas vesicle protein GvpN